MYIRVSNSVMNLTSNYENLATPPQIKKIDSIVNLQKFAGIIPVGPPPAFTKTAIDTLANGKNDALFC